MWPRLRIDLGWKAWFKAWYRCSNVFDEDAERLRVEACPPAPGAPREALHGAPVACLSARSGFDLLLKALELPTGSEVLFSSMTVPDMAKVASWHGMEPHGVDLEPSTLLPSVRALEAAVTPATRVLVVAQLFGNRSPLRAIASWCRAHDVILVEDAAQAYAGALDPDPEADASLFSFGSIKTATALGGGLLFVRDPALRARVRAAQETFEVQPQRAYARRVWRALWWKTLQTRPVFSAVTWLAGRLGVDLDGRLRSATRGFPGDDLQAQLRQRPCPALLGTLAARLEEDHGPRIRRRTAHGEFLRARLGADAHGERVPGGGNPTRTHWVLPVRVPDREAAVRRLGEAGFDVAGASSLGVVGEAPVAARLLDELLFLPVYPELTEDALQRLVRALDPEGETSSPPA